MVNRPFGDLKVKVFAAGQRPRLDLSQVDSPQVDLPQVAFDASDEEVLLQHAALGCVSLWCTTSERAYPFVFRPRLVRGVIPCAQLIFCRDLADFVRFAGPIGRFLARYGRPFVILDANAPIPGLLGWYSRATCQNISRAHCGRG